MNRKTFIKQNLLLGGALAAGTSTMIAGVGQAQKDLFDQELILEFVFAAHKSLEETRTILDKYPLLLNCTSQFKKRDFETAVGGASHMGRKDIADFLVSRGARLDIFNYAFLGCDDFVKKWVTDYPNFLKCSRSSRIYLASQCGSRRTQRIGSMAKTPGVDRKDVQRSFWIVIL